MTPDDFRKIRKAAGLTQAEMAAKIGKSRQTVINWEAKVYALPDDILDQLAKVGFAKENTTSKPLAGEPWLIKVKVGGFQRQLCHPFWYLGVDSPYYRKLMAAEPGKRFRQTLMSDLDGFTEPTPQQAYDQLIAAGCDPESCRTFIEARGHYIFPSRVATLSEWLERNPMASVADYDAYTGKAAAPKEPAEPLDLDDNELDWDHGLERYIARRIAEGK